MDIEEIKQSVESAVEKISNEEMSFDVARYLAKRLPVEYPNKGIRTHVDSTQQIEVHHELFQLQGWMRDTSSSKLQSLIDFYGSCHQRDYCYISLGHRFNGDEKHYFRGVLGNNRLFKLLLMLRLIGFKSGQIVTIDHAPDYYKIVESDLKELPRSVDLIVIGGQVVFGSLLKQKYEVVQSVRGQIISYNVLSYSGRTVVQTSFPYGDLCEVVMQFLGKREIKSVIFTGSAGSIKDPVNVGDIVLPAKILGPDGNNITFNFRNCFLDSSLIRDSAKVTSHANVATPLIETRGLIEDMRRYGSESIDVEVMHFQLGCEKYLQCNSRIGVLCYIIDRPFSSRTISLHDYSMDDVVKLRNQVGSLVQRSLEEGLWD